jgi:hypothetical protein
MATPEELLDAVVDKNTFIAFVSALADEREEAEEIERADPKAYSVDGALGWKNGDIAAFLNASLEYFTEGPFHKPARKLSWRMFAEFLYHGKIIE